MVDPQSLAGSFVGAGIGGSLGVILGAQVDALVIGALAAIFVSAWLPSINSLPRSLAAVLFSSLLAAYASPVAMEWVASSMPSVASNLESLRRLLALVIGAIAPSTVPIAMQTLGRKMKGARP